MRRSDLSRVGHPPRIDPKRSRVFVVVSRQVRCDTAEDRTGICAPGASSRHGLATQGAVGEAEGRKHASPVHCDGLGSRPKTALTDYVGRLGPQKLAALQVALKVARDLLDSHRPTEVRHSRTPKRRCPVRTDVPTPAPPFPLHAHWVMGRQPKTRRSAADALAHSVVLRTDLR